MATNRKLTEEQEKEIKILQASNEMLERTKKEAKSRGKDSVKMIEIAQQDVITQMKSIDSDIADELIEHSKKSEEAIEDVVINTDNTKSVYDAINEMNNTSSNVGTQTNVETRYYVPEATQEGVQYDVISLPSNGEGYKNKLSKVPVAYLTAYDENFITSPNLYRDGLIIDFLLKNKIVNKDINPDELLKGDVDAIILFLRATSYGTDFPISVRDPETGEQIESVVDLSTLKTKEFKLKGDKNGYFDFTLPLSKDRIKFKYLTRKDEQNLEMVSRLETKVSNAALIRRDAHELKRIVDNSQELTESRRKELNDSIDKFNNLARDFATSQSIGYNKIITNRMEMSIVAVNDNYDRNYIHNYINNMRAKDSLELRKYINENEPGIDFSITVKRPESLGGGSFETFLEWSDSVFLNIA